MADSCLPLCACEDTSSCIRRSWSWRPGDTRSASCLGTGPADETDSNAGNISADAHSSGVSMQRAANAPTTSTSVCFSGTGPVHLGRSSQMAFTPRREPRTLVQQRKTHPAPGDDFSPPGPSTSHPGTASPLSAD